MRVNANVLLRNPQTGVVTVINAGDEVPGWAESLVGKHLTSGDAETEVETPEVEVDTEVETPKPAARRGRR